VTPEISSVREISVNACDALPVFRKIFSKKEVGELHPQREG
jgi:hypothetical protein